MDNVTHALAGLLLADATVALIQQRTGQPVSRAVRRAAAVVGVVAAELPDADLLYSGPVLGMGKLGYLLHHRGHTHTMVVALLLALVVWGMTLLVSRAAREPVPWRALLGLVVVAALSHLLLDWTNSYGVHPFWPVNNNWFYGDAVFIVEPWLWVVAIPPLLAGQRSKVGYTLLALALGGILLAAWLLDIVGFDVALALSVFAVVWLSVMRRLRVTSGRPRPNTRIALAISAWGAVTVAGVVASRAARAGVAEDIAPRIAEDIVLSPAPGNPLCFEMLLVERDGATYRVTAASVASFPRLREASGCVSDLMDNRRAAPPGIQPIGGGMQVASRESSARVLWRREWSAPLAELQQLQRSHCEVAAALGFMRAPAWDQRSDGTVRMSDLRFGEGGNGFADLVFAAAPANCPSHVPSWTPPRRALWAP